MRSVIVWPDGLQDDKRLSALANETESVACSAEGETGDFEEEDHGGVSMTLMPGAWAFLRLFTALS